MSDLKAPPDVCALNPAEECCWRSAAVLHKYERGVNRVSAGRLFEIARVLRVPVGYFYEGIGEEPVRPLPLRERMVLEITRNFIDITDERHQQALVVLTRALAGTHIRTRGLLRGPEVFELLQ